jgi:hypothetical protein
MSWHLPIASKEINLPDDGVYQSYLPTATHLAKQSAPQGVNNLVQYFTAARRIKGGLAQKMTKLSAVNPKLNPNHSLGMA